MHTSNTALSKEHLVPVLTLPLERTTAPVTHNKKPQPEIKNDEKTKVRELTVTERPGLMNTPLKETSR